jgi:Escherichia/Staphylococcus phage prohead protease
MELERRPFGWDRRAIVGGTPSHPMIHGTAIVFDQRSQDLGGFVEVIRPEAFRRTLDEGIDLRAFFDHDPAKVLGRQSAGTLKVIPDARGVQVEIDPPNPTEPPNLLQSIGRGDITGMSFSFRTLPEGEDWKREDGRIVRYVTDMRVYEVSVVSMPAYSQTDVEVALRGWRKFQGLAAPTISALQQRSAARAAGWSPAAAIPSPRGTRGR